MEAERAMSFTGAQERPATEHELCWCFAGSESLCDQCH
jgi:hypothetical protein